MVTVVSSHTRGLEGMVSTSREMGAFERQMSGLVGILLRLIDDQGSIILHVTAANPGEGTSTIARGLAAAAAQASWCKVALLDASGGDVALATEALPDVLQSFDAAKKLPLAVQSMAGANVSVGMLALASTAAPNLETVRTLYGSLRSAYTLTIVDCPAVNVSQAAITYSRLADGVLLVVSAERTRRSDVERAQVNLTQFGATVLGTVMNQSRRRVPRFLDRFL